VVGPKVKGLRPDTPLAEILAWLEAGEELPRDSLDTIELMMALEDEYRADAQGARPRLETFRDLVLERARRRAA
jgi:acyl carrier protein